MADAVTWDAFTLDRNQPFTLCPTWGGLLQSDKVEAMQYHVTLQCFQEAQAENERLRKRIAELEAQVAEHGI